MRGPQVTVRLKASSADLSAGRTPARPLVHVLVSYAARTEELDCEVLATWPALRDAERDRIAEGKATMALTRPIEAAEALAPGE